MAKVSIQASPIELNRVHMRHFQKQRKPSFREGSTAVRLTFLPENNVQMHRPSQVRCGYLPSLASSCCDGPDEKYGKLPV